MINVIHIHGLDIRFVKYLTSSVPGKREYSIPIWKGFTAAFHCMPIAAEIGNEIFCVHGGIGPSLTCVADIESIPRPTDVPESGLLYDLVWSETNKELVGWGGGRGALEFGEDIVHEYVAKLNVKLICRSNQVLLKLSF